MTVLKNIVYVLALIALFVVFGLGIIFVLLFASAYVFFILVFIFIAAVFAALSGERA